MVNFDGHFDGQTFDFDVVMGGLRLDNMKLKLWTYAFCVLLHVGNCIKIYEWQRDWGQGVFTRELAQVIPETQQIIHSAMDKSYQNSVPTISLSLYNVTSEQFPNGILVIRPLLTEGHQVCFIGQLSGQWSSDYNTVHNRQGATIPADFPPVVYALEMTFPGDFDPLKVASITDFCEVDLDHMLYLNPTTNVSNDSTVLDIQGLFSGYAVVVTEEQFSILPCLNFSVE